MDMIGLWGLILAIFAIFLSFALWVVSPGDVRAWRRRLRERWKVAMGTDGWSVPLWLVWYDRDGLSIRNMSDLTAHEVKVRVNETMPNLDDPGVTVQPGAIHWVPAPVPVPDQAIGPFMGSPDGPGIVTIDSYAVRRPTNFVRLLWWVRVRKPNTDYVYNYQIQDEPAIAWVIRKDKSVWEVKMAGPSERERLRAVFMATYEAAKERLRLDQLARSSDTTPEVEAP